MATVECLVLEGKKGIAEGERFYLNYGQTMTIGRSRACEFCLAKLEKYKTLSAEEEKGIDILSISRKHLQITLYHAQSIELKDLSTNGTFINGKRIDKKYIIPDIKKKSYEIKLGKRETFNLRWGTRDSSGSNQTISSNQPPSQS